MSVAQAVGLCEGWGDQMVNKDIRWLSWCNQRAGNDGRRPSGVQWQRTKLNHAVKGDGFITLCNREVRCLPVPEEKHSELPRCKVCSKRSGS